MIHKILLIITILLLVAEFRQAHAQQVITTAGGETLGTNGSLSYSVGQIVYNSFQGSNGSMDQGVIQLTVKNQNPLPVGLLNFRIKINENNTVVLTWTTATEMQNDFFTIERSKDGKEFENLAKVKGAGNSNQNLEYSFLDQTPLKGQGFYRLKQTDFNGSSSFSQMISVLNRSAIHSISIYPNPTSQHIILKTDLANFNVLSYNILNMKGMVISQAEITKTETNIDLNNLESGLYTLTIIKDHTQTETFKIIKN